MNMAYAISEWSKPKVQFVERWMFELIVSQTFERLEWCMGKIKVTNFSACP
jgi:hypothetical protein